MTEISSLTAPHRQPNLHVPVVAALGIGYGEQESFSPVEETGAQHVGPQKGCKPVADSAHERDPPARRQDGRGAGGRITVDSRQRVLRFEHRMMNQRRWI